MHILKTYARMWVEDLDTSLPLLEQLVGKPADLRFPFGEVEIAAVGDFLVIAGTPEQLEPYRRSTGPVIVDDLEDALRTLRDAGAVVTRPVAESPTGQVVYLRHPDGAEMEYVQWVPDLVARIIGPG